MLHLLLFLLFAGLALGAAITVVAAKHPINSALSLIIVMGSLAIEYFLLGAEFLGAIQVIVYAGAIMVLFVFVIMLLNAGIEARSPRGSRVAYLFGVPGVVAGAIMVVWMLVRRSPAADSVSVGELYGSAEQIGKLLFKPFLLPFEVTSILILIAIMGAVVLARREDV